MVNQYKVKVEFNKLVKTWDKLNRVGFFLTRSPTRIGKKTIITLIFFSKSNQQKALKILEQNPKRRIKTPYIMTKKEWKKMPKWWQKQYPALEPKGNPCR